MEWFKILNDFGLAVEDIFKKIFDSLIFLFSFSSNFLNLFGIFKNFVLSIAEWFKINFGISLIQFLKVFGNFLIKVFEISADFLRYILSLF